MDPEDDSSCVTFWGKSVFSGLSGPPWNLSFHPQSGYFAMGTKSFTAGELILTEYPTTWTRAWHPFTADDIMRIEDEIIILPKDERDAFYAMSNVYPDINPPSVGIYMTNSFDLPNYDSVDENVEDDKEPAKASGMFLAIGRLNHSCVPNAQQTYIPKQYIESSRSSSDRHDIEHDSAKTEVGCDVLYASRDIGCGEQLCDCYIELRQTTEQRRKELQKLFRFHCTCTACGPATDAEMTVEELALRKEDDSRRKRAMKLEDDVLQYVNMGEMQMAIDIGAELVKLLEHEKSRGWGERYIAEACVNTSRILLEEGYKARAMAYLEKAHSWNVKLQGANSAESRNTFRKIEELKGVPKRKQKK